MTDQIKGEVLVPTSRFLPKCACADPLSASELKRFGDSYTTNIAVWCRMCGEDYEEELPYGVEGIPHGNP